MPDNKAPVSSPAVPVPQEGTSLWNMQTQAPEWVPLDQVKAKLASGSHRAYAGSDVPLTPGIGGETQLSPEKAATAVAGGAAPTHSEESRGAVAREQTIERAFDNAGDKALALVDGIVEGLSGGLLEGVPGGGELGKIEREKRGSANSGYKTLGELAAIAGTVLAPESALKYTPLGASNKAFEAASKATSTALAGKLGGVANRAVSDAVGGAVAAGALSSANAVSQAVQGKPVSGYAILDDIGLGGALGFGIGAVAEKLASSARKSTELAKQMEAAARFDESAAPVRGTLVDVAKSWDSAHNVAAARYDALEDLVNSKMLDAELPGAEWLKARTTAKKAADDARAKLHKLAGTEDPQAIGERLHDLAVSGKAKEAQKLYKAFDDYGTAVSALDDAMQPTTFDNAHLGDVIGDIDVAIPSSEHPMQRLEHMINNGAPQEEIERFARDLDENYRKAQGKGTPDAETVDLPSRATGRESPGAKVKEVRGEQDLTKPEPYPAPPEGTILPKWAQQGEVPKVSGKPFQDTVPLDDENVQSVLLGGSRAGNEQAGFQAKKILDQVRVERSTGVMSPVRPTDLGQKIQTLIDQLTAATGNKLGSVEARALANSLGMNTAALNGPVASKLADLWSLHRMSEELANQLGKKGPRQAKTTLTKALSWGVVSGAGHVGYETGGAVASGVMRSLARQALGTALYGAAAVSSAAGRFRQSAVNGLSKALNPVGRRALGLGAITKVVSSTYAPGAEPTTDYNTKAAQLRWMAQNPKPTEEHFKKAFSDIGAVDPMAYTATVDAAMTRMKNLAAALPKSGSWSMSAKHKGPTDAQIMEWHQYEAVTADKELVFKYLKAGYMPRGVVSAMNEQHPDYMQEIREYVLNNPNEVQSASHDTQMALSALLGVPLVPEANPQYVRRMQEPYQEAKQKAASAQMQAKGAQAINPLALQTLGQVLGAPR